MREYCIQCAIEDEDEGRPTTRLRYDPEGRAVYPQHHHGKSCRYSRCTKHCTCSRELRREWSTLVTEASREARTIRSVAQRRRNYVGNRIRNGAIIFECAECRTPSSHICVQRSASLRTAQNQYGVMSQRRCGACCGDAECRNRGTDCNSTQRFTLPELRNCDTCARPTPLAALVDDNNGSSRRYCFACVGLWQCGSCNRIPNLRNTLSNQSAYRAYGGCARCGHCYPTNRGLGLQNCCRCERNNGNSLRLHQCGVFTGHKDIQKVCERRNPLVRTIGVELEVGGFRDPKIGTLDHLYNTCVKWHTAIGTDSSIKSPTNNGVEIRTSPASGTTFLRQLGEVMQAIRQANGFVNKTCGLHVHIGMDKETANRNPLIVVPRVNANPEKAKTTVILAPLMHAFAAVEDVMYELVSDERRVNDNDYGRYCMKLKAQRDWVYSRDRAQNKLNDYGSPFRTYGDRQTPVTPLERDWLMITSLSRYSGLNLYGAYTSHGTVEFRLHHGCLDYNAVSSWALLCCAFVETVMNAQDQNALIEVGIKPDPAAFLYAIAPTDTVKEYVAKLLRSHFAKGKTVKFKAKRERTVTTRKVGRRAA